MGLQESLVLVEEAHGKESRALVEHAYMFMKEAHTGQFRIGGDEYYTHPESVAKILVEQGNTDPELLAAALLHDVVEDTKYTLEDIKEIFGETISFMVDGVTNVGEGDGAEKITDKLDRMKATQKKVLLLGQQDARIFLIKVADRIHNLMTLDVLSDEQRNRIKDHSKLFYRKFAEEIGEQEIIDQLDDLLKE